MITIYQCEKCGEKFSEWKDAHKCEDSHVVPRAIESGSRWGHCELYTEYPSTIIVNMRDKNGETTQAAYIIDEEATNKLHMETAKKEIDMLDLESLGRAKEVF